VSGRWDGFNGAEYVVFRQRRGGRLDVTVHHTCAPGHVEHGSGRISAGHVRGRVEPVSQPPPPACVRFATIDVRVDPDGRRMRGRYTTDRGSGRLLYIGARRARSLVRFRPRITRARPARTLRVLLRPRPELPAGVKARVSLCRVRSCSVHNGRYGPLFKLRGRRCGLFVARVSFAGARASTRRRICA